jgi:hypothetical protein
MGIAAMQTTLLVVVFGIHKLFLIATRSCSAAPEGGIHVQDCIHRPPSLQHPDRPLNGLVGPPQTASSRTAIRNGDPLLGGFGALTTRASRVRSARCSAPSARYFDQWPRVSGAIFHGHVSCPDCRHLRQIGLVDNTTQKPFASWHIIYKNTSNAHTNNQERTRGMGTCSPQGTANAIRPRAGSACMPQRFPAHLKSTIGRKERMPPRSVHRTIQPCNVRDEASIAATRSWVQEDPKRLIGNELTSRQRTA